MEIKLKRLILINFKGVDYFDLETGTESVSIVGRNGTGKSTTADAFYWLFDDADSDGQTRFQILNLDESGQVINKKDAEVEAWLLINNQELVIKKIFRQKWVTPRGQIEEKFEGHTTDYFINDEYMKKKEFIASLNKIFDLDLFRSLADVHYFCGIEKIEKKRAILMQLLPEFSDESIIDREDEFAALKEILKTHEIEKYIKILKMDISAADRKLKELPHRIRELNEKISRHPDISAEQLKEKIGKFQTRIRESLDKIHELMSGQAIVELKTENSKIEGQIYALRSNYDTPAIDRLVEKINHNSSKINEHTASKAECQHKISECAQEIRLIENNKQILFREWQAEERKMPKDDDVCVTCGQPIPANHIQKIKNNQQMILNEINEKGQKLNQEHIQLKEKMNNLEAQRNELDFLIAQERETHKQIETKIGEKKNLIDNDVAAKKDTLQQKINENKRKIADLEKSAEPMVHRIEAEIEDFNEQKAKLERQLAAIDLYNEDLEFMRLRQEELKEYAARYEKAQAELELIGTFKHRKAELIEQNVSELFEFTEWKLFEKQVNETLKEICEPTYKGVPFSSDLNTGSRIRIGLDVIRTLSKHFKTKLPIFVDNAEAVTEWHPINHQIIKLIARENVDELKIERNGNAKSQ